MWHHGVVVRRTQGGSESSAQGWSREMQNGRTGKSPSQLDPCPVSQGPAALEGKSPMGTVAAGHTRQGRKETTAAPQTHLSHPVTFFQPKLRLSPWQASPVQVFGDISFAAISVHVATAPVSGWVGSVGTGQSCGSCLPVLNSLQDEM